MPRTVGIDIHMCVYVHIHVYTKACICIHVHAHNSCISLYVHIHTCIHMYMCIHIYIGGELSHVITIAGSRSERHSSAPCCRSRTEAPPPNPIRGPHESHVHTGCDRDVACGLGWTCHQIIMLRLIFQNRT